MSNRVTIVGGGLAGCECAWQLAERGVEVTLVEQKPHRRTPAQKGDGLAELVCSNSFRGAAIQNAVGLLKEEMRRAGSLVMAAGEVARVPAGGAFAVDRDVFSAEVTRRVEAHPRITVEHRVVEAIPEDRPVVLATGPLTGDALATDLAHAIGEDHLAYYDAIAPVVTAESLDWSKVFRASRYGKGGDDAYVNCPLDEDEYRAFVRAVLEAEKVAAHDFEDVKYFEGCLPLEVMAERGEKTLAFGPMKPVGLVDPRTGRRPWAVVQLRQENREATAYNLVGFQTRMKWPEQKRVFRMIPGLEHAEFERLGSVHRNTFVDSPRVLAEDLSLKARPGVHLAGQISGVEGYVESAACGLVLGTMLAARARGEAPTPPPRTTAFGSLLSHLRDVDAKDFQPSNVVFSLFPAVAPPPGKKKLGKRERKEAYAARALADLEPWLDAVGARLVRAQVEGTAASVPRSTRDARA
ncbi:MAG TPA: methylenetetrahydrofolate--tRNA-(uracil(54)-C(5))-methyltransferase (FADH(2)-oxidizing) TrmFO [Sandaracinaceae bacterium LLY-WYZ-13_1]|nr:methylenetetrahydrofolate--tRNA-(uracil(54)-C(5))-methyltransferase (FADH(2)-oxidizing) TrmFO [Sandaracinaceae bacterium LLY-WYZ-13_1]